MTIQRLNPQIDAGDIIHHSVPEPKKGDGFHDVACRAVTQVAEDLEKILNLRKEGHRFEGTPPKKERKTLSQFGLGNCYPTCNLSIV